MRRRDLSLTIALCVSLLMHGLGMFALVRQEVARLVAALHQPPIDLSQLSTAMPGDAPEPPKPTPPAPPLPPDPDVLELFGERGSKGDASNASAGDVPMQAREAPEAQASLTTNPGDPTRASSSGDGGAPARPAQEPRPERAAAAAPAQVTPFGPPVDPAAPFGIPLAPAPEQMAPKPFRAPSKLIAVQVPTQDASPTTQSTVTAPDSPATRPVETAATKPVDRPLDVATIPSPVTDAATTRPVEVAVDTPRPTTAPIGQMPTTTQPVPARPPLTAVASAADTAHPVDALPPAPAAPAPQAPAGDVGNKSESESDAFSKKPMVVYRDGKVEAQDGRRVKTVKPKLTEAGRLALLSMDEPVVILVAHIDEKGKVTGVDFERHSGSNEVDLPAYRALYDWEFEPSKDRNGRPKPDVLIIPFIWR